MAASANSWGIRPPARPDRGPSEGAANVVSTVVKPPGEVVIDAEIAELIGNVPFDPDALRDKYREERDKRRPVRRQRAVRRGHRRLLQLRRRPLRRAGLHPRAGVRRHRGRHHRRRLRRPADGRAPQGGRLHRHPPHRAGRRRRRHLVLEPLPGRDVRRRVVRLPAAARGARLHPEAQVLLRPRDPRVQPDDRPPLRPLRRRPVPDRRHRARAGTTPPSAGSSAPTAATASGPASWRWPTARSTGRSCPASPASTTSRATRSTPAAGTTSTRAATPTGTSTSSPTSGSASSAPAPRRSSASPTSARRPRSCTSSSARRRPLTSATTARPTPTGPPRSTPGWQQRRMDNFNILVSGGDQDEDLVADGWTDIFRKLTGIAAKTASRQLGRRLSSEEKGQLMELADFQKMERSAAASRTIVEDPATAEKLKPWYRQFCKRPCFHDEYLPTFNRPNVHLVDTEGLGVERLTERGVVVNGTEYEVDCLIFATGFEVGTGYTRRSGYDLVGRDGVLLSDKWQDGLRTLLRHADQRLPELLLPRLHPVGGDGERAARPQRAGQAHHLHPRPGPPARRHARSRSASTPRSGGRTRSARRPASASASTPSARPATTTTRASRGTPTACSPATTAPARSRSSSCWTSGVPRGRCPASS